MLDTQNEQNPTTYQNLSSFEQGCIDCIVECERNGDHADEWEGIGYEDFLSEALQKIIADCGQFMSIVSGGDHDFEDTLFGDFDEYDLGYHLHLERQGTGVGFAEMFIGQPLLSRLQMSAAVIGEVNIRVGEDRKIRIQPHLTRVSSPAG